MSFPVDDVTAMYERNEEVRLRELEEERRAALELVTPRCVALALEIVEKRAADLMSVAVSGKKSERVLAHKELREALVVLRNARRFVESPEVYVPPRMLPPATHF